MQCDQMRRFFVPCLVFLAPINNDTRFTWIHLVDKYFREIFQGKFYTWALLRKSWKTIWSHCCHATEDNSLLMPLLPNALIDPGGSLDGSLDRGVGDEDLGDGVKLAAVVVLV